MSNITNTTIASILQELTEFFRRADKTEFIAVFGERMGVHLWDKLVYDYERDFGNLLCVLDGSNLRLLAEHLKKKGGL